MIFRGASGEAGLWRVCATGDKLVSSLLTNTPTAPVF